MKIYKILNNNVAIIKDEAQHEKIVMGKGIGFKKRVGEEIDEAAVEKVFCLTNPEANSKLQTLIREIPMEYMALGDELVAEAEIRLGKKLNDMLYVSLIDHIYTAVVRFLDGIFVKNILLWDIRRFYKKEYEIGLWALEVIKEKFKVSLPEDEAGFIALHIVNAGMDEQNMQNMYEITKIIQEIENIVKYYFHTDFDEEDVYYYRFITHLKFFAKRLSENKTYDDDGNDDLLEIIKAKYEKSYACVEKITAFIYKKYGHMLSGDEKLYLTIHIERVIDKIKHS